MLHAKLRNRTCQGLERQGQGQGLNLVLNESLRTEWDTTVLGHSESQRVGHYQLYLVPAEWDNNRRAAAATSGCSAAVRHDANTAVATAAAAKAAWYNQRRVLSGRPLLLGASNGVVYIYIFIIWFCAASAECRASSDVAICRSVS